MTEEKGGNGKLETPDLGKASTPDLGHAGSPKKKPSEETKKEPPKDYKIAEIWIENGQVALQASPEFWMDKLRALGVLDYCKDIVKQYVPKKEKNRILPVGMNDFRNFLKGGFRRKR